MSKDFLLNIFSTVYPSTNKNVQRSNARVLIAITSFKTKVQKCVLKYTSTFPQVEFHTKIEWQSIEMPNKYKIVLRSTLLFWEFIFYGNYEVDRHG